MKFSRLGARAVPFREDFRPKFRPFLWVAECSLKHSWPLLPNRAQIRSQNGRADIDVGWSEQLAETLQAEQQHVAKNSPMAQLLNNDTDLFPLVRSAGSAHPPPFSLRSVLRQRRGFFH